MIALDEDRIMLRDSAREFLADKSPVSELRRLRDSRSEDGFSRELWSGMKDMGWTGILVDEDHGGSDFGHVGMALVCEEMGRTLTASPFLSTAVMAATAIRRGGSDEQKKKWLPAISDAKTIVALAIDEGRKHNPEATALKAEMAGNAFRLNGDKTFVVDGHIADQIIVAARTDGEPGNQSGISLFLIDAKSPGISIERVIGVDSRNSARIKFDNVHAAGADALGEIGKGYGLLENALNAGRTGLSAEMLGVASESFDRTVSYLKERKQFGKFIGEFQALQHRAAHLFGELELLRSLVLSACVALDKNPDTAGSSVSAAKFKAAEVVKLAVSEAVQMFGGMGMTDEVDIGLFMKRSRVTQEFLGDANFHADRFARSQKF
ncbi:MAG TPA: acyl-CoA dehydrogenase [Xanthobacteraceae bacterium]|nr:acyl-CoA dehydrogenase [Xanthobacteraceae bacterium]